MNGMVSCEYNMDSGCIELKFVDGTEIAIDCTTVENLQPTICMSVLSLII